MPDVKRVVLAYSGGLDTSVILRWLIETYECEVVAYCADLGQGEELIPIRDKALKTGAVGVHVVDLRETFVRDFIFPMLRANASLSQSTHNGPIPPTRTGFTTPSMAASPRAPRRSRRTRCVS